MFTGAMDAIRKANKFAVEVHTSLKRFIEWIDPILVPLLAILTSMIVGGIIIKSVGGDPILAYKGCWKARSVPPNLVRSNHSEHE
jgi:hypothetical protein